MNPSLPLPQEAKDPWSLILAEPSQSKKTFLWLSHFALKPLIDGFFRGVTHLFVFSTLLSLY